MTRAPPLVSRNAVAPLAVVFAAMLVICTLDGKKPSIPENPQRATPLPFALKKLDPYNEEVHLDWEFVKDKRAEFVQFRKGALVKFEAVSENVAPGVGSGVIKDQSRASRHRAAFAFGNAECVWHSMSLLTYRHVPGSEAVKQHVANLREKWRARWGESTDGWMMEMHERGVPHFHVFHAAQSNFGIECATARKELITRKRKQVTVVRGEPDFWLASAWMDCIGCTDRKTQAFNAGGIIEVMRHPDGAGRYIAKEAAKREQKILPERYAEGLGRWWWLNPRWKPKAINRGVLDLQYWPYEHPLAHVWDANDLTPAVVSWESVKAHVLDCDNGKVTEVPNDE